MTGVSQRRPCLALVSVVVVALGLSGIVLSFLMWLANDRSLDIRCALAGLSFPAHSDLTAGAPAAGGCAMNVASVSTITVPMPPGFDAVTFWPTWYPQVPLVVVALLPWAVVAAEVTSRRRMSSHSRRYGPTPLVVAVVIGGLLGGAALAAWPAQAKLAAQRCRAGTYIQPHRPSEATGGGCRVRTNGVDRLTVPALHQAHLLQMSALLTLLMAAPPSVLVVYRRRQAQRVIALRDGSRS